MLYYLFYMKKIITVFRAPEFYIFLVATFFIFCRISFVDMVGDDAVYSLRSVGYLDFMFADTQTTSLDWFKVFPAWANLSFHDHPPLLFVIQHIFLLLKENIFFAKLPYALFGLGSIAVLYVWTKAVYGRQVALLSCALLSVNAFFIYSTRVTYLEGGVVFFCLLTLYCFYLFLQDTKKWWAFGLTLGLCLLTKYTALFMLPTIAVYILWKKRELVKQSKLYYAFFLTLIIISPVIIYNVMMFKTVGHFDLQFSRLFGGESAWGHDGAKAGFRNPIGILKALAYSLSFPYLFLSLLSLCVAFFYHKRMHIYVLGILFLTVMFSFIGSANRFLVLYNIFLATPLAYVIVTHYLQISRKNIRHMVKGCIVIFISFLFLFSYNSHIATKPFLEKHTGWSISASQSKNYGLFQLETYLETLFAKKEPTHYDGYTDMKKKKASLKKYVGPTTIPSDGFSYIIVYDQNISWFSEMWLFKRQRFYHNMPIFSTKEFKEMAESVDPIAIKELYFIKATEFTKQTSSKLFSDYPNLLEKKLQENTLEPLHINRIDGNPAFVVYHLVF